MTAAASSDVARAVRLHEPVRVRVPASSANLGPGFDALGLALSLYDEVVVTATDGCGDGPGGAVDVVVEGEGQGTVPCDDTHLVVRALRLALDEAGVTCAGVRLRAVNCVPHGRGLGSSAAATVAGLVAGRALAGAAGDDLDLLALATRLEGHPDNAAAALLGGLALAWLDGSGAPRAVGLPVHPDLGAVVAVPRTVLDTRTARRLLPDVVPHRDAAFTAGRAALIVEALGRRPELLLAATEERLHQEQRRVGMPETLELVAALRGRDLAAVVSGAGPSVLVLHAGVPAAAADRVAEVAGPRWDVRALDVADGAAAVPA